MSILDRLRKKSSKPTASAASRSAQLQLKLGKATSTTLNGCTQVAAIAILHERPNTSGFSEQRWARETLKQYKAPGWVPAALRVSDTTPVKMIHQKRTGSIDGPTANAVLADALATLAPATDPGSSECIAFSGDNGALGHTFFAVLAI